MKSTRRLVAAMLLLLVLLVATTNLVAAKELGLVVISGPGINGQVTLKDSQVLMKVQQMGFFDSSALTTVPQNLCRGYHLTGYLDLDGKDVPFVEAMYYPAGEGQVGYMHVVGGFNGETMKTTSVDRWSAVTPQAGEEFRQLAATENLTIQTAVTIAGSPSAVEPPAKRTSSVPTQLVGKANAVLGNLPALSAPLALLTILLLSAAGSWLYRRRREKAF